MAEVFVVLCLWLAPVDGCRRLCCGSLVLLTSIRFCSLCSAPSLVRRSASSTAAATPTTATTTLAEPAPRTQPKTKQTHRPAHTHTDTQRECEGSNTHARTQSTPEKYRISGEQTRRKGSTMRVKLDERA